MAATATLSIISIGEMGLGVAKLLKQNGFRVLTNINERSERTHQRATTAGIELVNTDKDLAIQSDYILSIVPPRDALATAQRIVTAMQAPDFPKRKSPLYYLDLNAISPRLSRELGTLFESLEDKTRFIDGGIIGGAPAPKDKADLAGKWSVPSIPMSGPHKLAEALPAGAELARLLHAKHITEEVGAASGLKVCFASLTKGFTALAVQSFTTASRLGVLTELQAQLSEHSPKTGQMTQSLTKMPPKAYRWVREMEEIGETFATDGGFGENESIFSAIAAVYETIAKSTELGKEVTEKRKRGTSVEDVAECVAEGLQQREAKRVN